MNLLDENILASQRELLRSWKVSIHQVGFDFHEKGLQDDQIISLLHQHRRTTFYTRDLGFYHQGLCHKRYCLACLAVSKDEVALFVRRLLRHTELRVQAKRLGAVIHVSQRGIRFWKLGTKEEQKVSWD